MCDDCSLSTRPEGQRAQELARIQRLLLEQPWPTGFPADLETRLTGLAGDSSTRWAVRSSATNEDAADMSAAGLYRTTLGVPLAAVLQSIRDCWISLWDERVFRYFLRSGADRPCPAMAVVIQPMLSAQAAGVAYSIHPVTGRTSQVSIDAVPGLASSLVNGVVTPDQYVVEVYDDDHRPFRVRRRMLAWKRNKLTATPGGVREKSIPEPEQRQACSSSHGCRSALKSRFVNRSISNGCWMWSDSGSCRPVRLPPFDRGPL